MLSNSWSNYQIIVYQLLPMDHLAGQPHTTYRSPLDTQTGSARYPSKSMMFDLKFRSVRPVAEQSIQTKHPNKSGVVELTRKPCLVGTGVPVQPSTGTSKQPVFEGALMYFDSYSERNCHLTGPGFAGSDWTWLGPWLGRWCPLSITSLASWILSVCCTAVVSSVPLAPMTSRQKTRHRPSSAKKGLPRVMGASLRSLTSWQYGAKTVGLHCYSSTSMLLPRPDRPKQAVQVRQAPI